MIKGASLKQNIEWLLEQYKKDLEEENKNKNKLDTNNYMVILGYENIIMELEFALNISK